MRDDIWLYVCQISQRLQVDMECSANSLGEMVLFSHNPSRKLLDGFCGEVIEEVRLDSELKYESWAALTAEARVSWRRVMSPGVSAAGGV